MMASTLISRRAMLAGGAVMMAAPARALSRGIAVIDWGLLETLLALGLKPAAATELIQFRRLVIEPPLAPGVVDLGLRGAPNYELLQMLRPDRIVISNFYEAKRRPLERIAPVVSYTLFRPGASPYALAVEAARGLGATFDRVDAATRLIARAENEIVAARRDLARFAGRPVFIVGLGDARHFQAFGSDSMFGDVLSRIGVTNAWPSETRYSAAAPVGLEALAAVPDAAVIIVAPLPPDVRRSLASNAIWQALPAVRSRRIAVIEPVNHFGGLPAAQRFVRLFARAMSGMERASHG